MCEAKSPVKIRLDGRAGARPVRLSHPGLNLLSKEAGWA